EDLGDDSENRRRRDGHPSNGIATNECVVADRGSHHDPRSRESEWNQEEREEEHGREEQDFHELGIQGRVSSSATITPATSAIPLPVRRSAVSPCVWMRANARTH